MNKLRGTFNVVAVKAPGYGDRRKEMLQDIAILTGGQVISEELGFDLKETTMDQLGRAKSVKVQKRIQLSLTDVETRTQSQIVLDRSRKQSKRQHLISTERNFRRDLQNLQAELLLSV